MRAKTFFAGCVVSAVTVAILFAIPIRADEKQKPKANTPKKPTVMQRKLTHSQKVLEGLANEDFGKISTGADGLIECVKEETWKINETDKYLLYTNDFLRRVEDLKKAAKNKNIDAAALAYVDMTLTCVKCHKYLREERETAVPLQLETIPTR